MREKMIERFFKYVKIDTQSQEGVEGRFSKYRKTKKSSISSEK